MKHISLISHEQRPNNFWKQFDHCSNSVTLAAVPVGSSLAASKEQKWALLAHSSPLATRAPPPSPYIRRRFVAAAAATIISHCRWCSEGREAVAASQSLVAWLVAGYALLCMKLCYSTAATKLRRKRIRQRRHDATSPFFQP